MPSVTLLVGIGNTDTAALLLGADGRVRGDADMVFEGQPVHPSGAVRHTKKSMSLALHEVEPEVERIVIAGAATSGSLAATAPDRAVVVAWLIARPDDAEAVVYGEFFRESGGWKFTGIGKGYASGLAELVTAYGVEVAEEEPAAGRMEKPAPGPSEKPVVEAASAPPAAAAVTGPVPLTGVVKGPGQVPSAASTPAPEATAGTEAPGGTEEPLRAPVATGSYPPADRPYELVAGWELGPVFEPFVVEGQGDDVITTDRRVPPGPVLVELAHQGDEYVSVWTLDGRNHQDEALFTTQLPEFRGSTVTPVPENRPLRVRLSAPNRWLLRVKPVAAARRLEGTLRGYGPEALLHTGGAADLRMVFGASPDGDRGYSSIWCHEVAGLSNLSPSPDLALSKTGARRETVPLPPGPLVLLLHAEGPWTCTLDELGPPTPQSR